MKKSVKNRMKFCLSIIIILQVVISVYFGVQKSGYHVDEMFTYTLANYKGGFVADTEGVLENWKSGEFYKEVLEVSKEEAFSYSIPYQNQIGDVHPPLYYFVIHTFSSIFDGDFQKWIGISVNILFNVLSALILFKVSKKLCKDDNLAIIITGVWALSNGAIESGIFARMYAMQTFFAIALVAIHIKAYEQEKERDGISINTIILLLTCTLLGVLTQYYYMVYCFFLCGIFGCYLLYSSKWKSLIRYLGAEFGALAVSVIIFPYMLKHIFSGYRGKQAFESVLNIQGYKNVLKSVILFISNDLFNGFGEEIVIFLVVTVAIIVIKRKVDNKKICLSEDIGAIFALVIVGMCYILVIAKIAPFQANRYYMCVYPLLTIGLVYGSYCIVRLKCSAYAVIILGVLSCLMTGSSYFTQEMEYLYKDGAIRAKQLAPYQGIPAIVLNGSYNYGPDNWIYEYENYDVVYRCTKDGELKGLENAIAIYDIKDGFLLYAHEINENDAELLKKIREYIAVEKFEKITDIYCRVFFCTLKENSN